MSVVEANPYAAPVDVAPVPGSADAPGRRRRRTTERPAPRPVPPLPPRSPVPDRPLVAITALLVLAALAVWFLLQVLVLGGLSQARAQRELHNVLREQLVAQTAPTGGALDPGVPVALLEIPTLGVQQVVVEGTSSGDLLAGPGHRRDTVLPGQAGVSIVYGRAATFGAPFRAVAMLREGDGITVTTGQGASTYRVDGVRREGDPLPAAPAAGGARLTLVTSEGDGPLAAIAPVRTVYVDATLVGDAFTGPAGRPGSIPDAERAFATDPGVLPVLALALQALLAAAVLATLVRRRVPGPVVWVLAVPPLVACAWLTTDAAVQLLPNLL